MVRTHRSRGRACVHRCDVRVLPTRDDDDDDRSIIVDCAPRATDRGVRPWHTAQRPFYAPRVTRTCTGRTRCVRRVARVDAISRIPRGASSACVRATVLGLTFVMMRRAQLAARHERITIDEYYARAMMTAHRGGERGGSASMKTTTRATPTTTTSDASIDSWFACGMDGEDEDEARGGDSRCDHGRMEDLGLDMATIVEDDDDDPLASLLNMSHEASAAFLLDGDGAASISAALDAVANQLKAVSANDVAAQAYAAPHSKESSVKKPSPLGNGVPALQQHAKPATLPLHAATAPPVNFAAASACYTGNLPQRVVSKERQAQLNRYRAKRERRLAGIKNNKVRYECRKTLADARPRVGGRFVKLTAEEKRMNSVQSCPDLSALADIRSSDVDMTDSAKDLTAPSFAPSVLARNKDDKPIGRLSMSSDDDSIVVIKAKRLSEDIVRPRLSNNVADVFPLPRLSSSEVSTEDEVEFTASKRDNDFDLPTSSSAVVRGLKRSSDLRHCQSEICLAALIGV